MTWDGLGPGTCARIAPDDPVRRALYREDKKKRATAGGPPAPPSSKKDKKGQRREAVLQDLQRHFEGRPVDEVRFFVVDFEAALTGVRRGGRRPLCVARVSPQSELRASMSSISGPIACDVTASCRTDVGRHRPLRSRSGEGRARGSSRN